MLLTLKTRCPSIDGRTRLLLAACCALALGFHLIGYCVQPPVREYFLLPYGPNPPASELFYADAMRLLSFAGLQQRIALALALATASLLGRRRRWLGVVALAICWVWLEVGLWWANPYRLEGFGLSGARTPGDALSAPWFGITLWHRASYALVLVLSLFLVSRCVRSREDAG